MDTFSSNGVGSIETAQRAIYSTICAISYDTRAHFLRVRHAKVNKQNGVGNHLRRR